MNKTLRLLALAASTIGLAACSDGPKTDAAASSDTTEATDLQSSTGQEPVAVGDLPPLPLSTDLCDEPDQMTVLVESSAGSQLLGSDQLDQGQVERMVAAPADGPIYLVTLRQYRDAAHYVDGRTTDLTGRQASALYDPTELLTAVGAERVYETNVDRQIDGDDIVWDTIEIIEYPCPLALFAILAHPDHQELAVHDAAGSEHVATMVADLLPLPPPADPDQSEAFFPPTADDPGFDLIHVMDFHDIAQYEPDADEPERTGREAWAEYQAGGTGASAELGHYPTAVLEVQGVLSGDDRSFDQILMVGMSSMEGFEALLDDSTRQDGRYHRYAALQTNYSMIAYPTLSEIPYYEGE